MTDAHTWLKGCFMIALTILNLPVCARSMHAESPTAIPVSASGQLRSILENLISDNDAFVSAHDEAYFRPLAAGQAPRATVVTCSDSRVHTHAFDQTPDGDLFMVRNIGNQLASDEASIEYGVHHLHTPLLIFIGHSACGAIKAASGNYNRESNAIRRELSTIRIPKGIASMAGVRMNVNNQVAAAMRKFRDEVRRGELTIAGAVYDFSNELGRGYGRLSVINLNGDTDPARIAANRLLEVPPKPVPTPKSGAERKPQAPAAPLGDRSAPPYSFP